MQAAMGSSKCFSEGAFWVGQGGGAHLPGVSQL